MKILMSLAFTFSNYPVCWFLRLFTPVFPSLNNQSSTARCTYSSTWEEAFIVNQAFFLLQIELNPVMEANHFCPVSWFTHKNMFKARWVQFPKKSNQFEPFKWTNTAYNVNQTKTKSLNVASTKKEIYKFLFYTIFNHFNIIIST